MNLRREFEKLIEKKRVEIDQSQKAIAAAEAYIQAMTDALKKLPKDDGVPVVRKGSEVEKIRDLIIGAERPLHLNEIIEGLGRSSDVDAKAKIAGLLGWYTSKGRVFTKTAPNTYGLSSASAPLPSPDIPDEFGTDDPIEAEALPEVQQL